jgi:hypothetical protein
MTAAVFMPPAWRWQRASLLIDRQQYPTRRDDERLVSAWRFLKRKREANDDELARLETEYPHVFDADRVHEDENGFRWFLEAALCSTAPIEEISRDHGFDVETVRVYNMLFFDVRDHLHSLPFVRTHILTPAMRNRTDIEGSPDFLPKLTALALGYDALMQLLTPWNTGPELQKFLMQLGDGALLAKCSEAANVLVVNNENAHDLVTTTLQMRAEKERTGHGDPDMAIEAVKTMLNAVTFRRRTAADVNILDADGREPRLEQPLQAPEATA